MVETYVTIKIIWAVLGMGFVVGLFTGYLLGSMKDDS